MVSLKEVAVCLCYCATILMRHTRARAFKYWSRQQLWRRFVLSQSRPRLRHPCTAKNPIQFSLKTIKNGRMDPVDGGFSACDGRHHHQPIERLRCFGDWEHPVREAFLGGEASPHPKQVRYIVFRRATESLQEPGQRTPPGSRPSVRPRPGQRQGYRSTEREGDAQKRQRPPPGAGAGRVSSTK